MGLHEAFADGEPEAAGPGGAAGLLRVERHVLREQPAERVGRHAAAPVADPHGDMRAVARGPDRDRLRLGRMPGGVRQQVADDLGDALPVGQHRGQVVRQVDAQRVARAAGGEGAARGVHQGVHRRRLRVHRQRARVDAPGIEEVADQPVHVVGLALDDAEELHQLRARRRGGGAEGRRRRALDRHQRRAQLVAHQPEERRPLALELVERRQVLQGHDDRDGLAVLAVDGRHVHERAHGPPVGHGQLHLLGAPRGGGAEHRRERNVPGRHLGAVGEPARQRRDRFLRGAFRIEVRAEQLLHDAPGLAVERRPARLRVEDRHAHRRGLDQRLEVGARAALVAQGPGVDDRGRGLRREQREDLFVVVGEGRPVRLAGQEEVADLLVAVAHGHGHQGVGVVHQVRRVAEAAHVVAQVREPERPGQVAHVGEQPRPVRARGEGARLGGREPGGDELRAAAPLADGHDHPPAGAGQGTGAVHHFLQHRVEVERRADAQQGRAERGGALLARRDAPRLLRAVHRQSPGLRSDCGRGAARRNGRFPAPPGRL